MKKVGLGLLIVGGLMVTVLGGFGLSGDVFAQRPQFVPPSGVGGDLLVVPVASGEKGQLLAVVEPRQHVMIIYRIDPATGKIALKSARNIHWDIQLNDFNIEAPLPQEIKSMLEQR
jgi:hypothetical protein